MPRPKTCRRVCCDRGHRYFEPQGVPISELVSRDLGFDELEAVRLSDLLGLKQAKAAKSMNISQPTFNRIISSARKKIADSLVNGHAIRIADSANSKTIEFDNVRKKCCRRQFRGSNARKDVIE